MGCYESSSWKEYPPSESKTQLQHKQLRDQHSHTSIGKNVAISVGPGGVPVFSEFSLANLKAATNNFNSEFIVSESGEKASNVVYDGRLQNLNNRRWITIKKFTKLAWPDPKQFAEEASGAGKLRNKKLANLIGYCCDGDERLLVAEYMPNDTLVMHLFHLPKAIPCTTT